MDIYEIFFKILLTLNSILIFVVIFFIKEEIWICDIKLFLIGIYILIPFVISCAILFFSNRLDKDSISGGIQSIELANGTYLPSYLGYFFVALSIPDNDYTTAWVVFCLIFVFTYNSQTLYYNPLFLLIGYNFYYVTSNDGCKIFVITRRKIKKVNSLEFSNLRRINDFTYIDKGK